METILLTLIFIAVCYYGHSLIRAIERNEFRASALFIGLESVIKQSSTETCNAIEKTQKTIDALEKQVGLITQTLQYLEKIDTTTIANALDSLHLEVNEIRNELSSIQSEVKAISHHPAFSPPDIDD